MTVTVTLTPEQEAWLAARVAKGDFASPEAAALRLLDASMADYAGIEQDDLAWAKPYVDEAIAQVDRGDVLTVEEHDARIDALMAKLTGK
jgi:antitoxin ParD1/3/4